jgi:hypothetical protein
VFRPRRPAHVQSSLTDIADDVWTQTRERVAHASTVLLHAVSVLSHQPIISSMVSRGCSFFPPFCDRCTSQASSVFALYAHIIFRRPPRRTRKRASRRDARKPLPISYDHFCVFRSICLFRVEIIVFSQIRFCSCFSSFPSMVFPWRTWTIYFQICILLCPLNSHGTPIIMDSNSCVIKSYTFAIFQFVQLIFRNIIFYYSENKHNHSTSESQSRFGLVIGEHD